MANMNQLAPSELKFIQLKTQPCLYIVLLPRGVSKAALPRILIEILSGLPCQSNLAEPCYSSQQHMRVLQPPVYQTTPGCL